MITLTHWETTELVDHLASRPDLWQQSEENESLWARLEDDEIVCAIIIIPPIDMSSPYRIFHIQEVAYTWNSEHVTKYVEWLIDNWTTRPNRLAIENFLVNDLELPVDVAFASAIAIESFDWQDHHSAEPAAPPSQEEFWPKDAPPRLLVEDNSHIGTYLLSGSTGWIRLRLLGGMIRVQLSLRAKTGEVLPLDGYVRAFTLDARSAASKLGGWPEREASPSASELPPPKLFCPKHPNEPAFMCPKCTAETPE